MSSPGGGWDVVVVPSALALLPAYAGLADPVVELRAACREAVAWLVSRHPAGVAVVAAPAREDNRARGVDDPAGARVGRHLLGEAGCGRVVGSAGTAAGVLVVANGSARRSEKAPGHLDDRAFGFNEGIGAALRGGDASALRALDEKLAEELWCFDVPAFHRLGELVEERSARVVAADVDYDDDPYGVKYWVGRWTCAS